MDEHNFKVYPEWLNAVHLIKQIIERMTPVFKEKRIDVKVSCPDELTLYADKERIQQVLVNILDNAQKHAQANSTITVVVTKTAEQVIIKINDEGEGIPEADLPHIYDRLYRVEKSRSRESGGAGLGLSISDRKSTRLNSSHVAISYAVY